VYIYVYVRLRLRSRDPHRIGICRDPRSVYILYGFENQTGMANQTEINKDLKTTTDVRENRVKRRIEWGTYVDAAKRQSITRIRIRIIMRVLGSYENDEI
jgi:hypothetical protein